MVGVDRGNPPAKSGTTAVNPPNTVVVPYGRRRQDGTPTFTLAEADHSFTIQFAYEYVRLLIFRRDLRHGQSGRPRESCSTARREDSRSILAIIGISTIRSRSAVHSVRLCCLSQLWLYVRYGTGCTCNLFAAAYRAYPVTVLSWHISQLV